MRCAQVAAILVAAALAWGCAGDRRQDGQGGAADVGGPRVAEAETRPVSASDAPLAELEPLGPGDVELYLKVMREAAARLGRLSASDRQALAVWRAMNNGATQAQVPTPEQLVALERAGELAAMEATVARELRRERRFGSISGRVDHFLEPKIETSAGEPLAAQEKARVQERIRRQDGLDRADAALLQPHRAEIVALRRQVRIDLPAVDATD